VEGIETRMVGREAEMSRLRDAFYTAIEDHELQMVTVMGEAGVGKSRLLHEFDNWAELLPETFYYFKGRALQAMQSLPYSLLRSLFAFRFRIDDTDAVEVVRDKLELGVGAGLGEGEEGRAAAHFIGHLVGFELADSPHLEAVKDDPRQTRDRAQSYITDYFKALAAENPVLILLEDLHWADDSSLDALNELALALVDQPVMISCAARPGLFERRPHWGEGQGFHRRLALDPLTKRNTRRLLHEILQKVDDVPEALSELVVAGAEGNPFFVEELIKMLVEDGVIVKEEERWRVEPARLSEVRVPPTLRGVLQARLDRLPIADRTVLQQASVVGRLFWDRAVVRIGQSAAEGVEQGEVLDALSALRGKEMVFRRETTAFSGAQEYVFKHNVLREVTYRSLLKRLRRIYHGLVADWLMEQGGERAGEYTGLIADHLELAGRRPEAIDYLLQAGDRARALYAHQEAISAYERALALQKELGDDEQAARTLMKLGLVYHTAFDFERARQAYQEGFALQQLGRRARAAARSAPAPHALRQLWSDPPTLDPALAPSDTANRLIEQLFAGLVDMTRELDVVPDVARAWEVSEGGRRYMFRLRDDVRWSDGVPVTAGDFEYAWKRLLNPATKAPYAQVLYDVKGATAYHQGRVSDPESVGVRALDDLTLVVELERPTGYFLQLLGRSGEPVPRHLIEAHGEAWTHVGNIVTNGPFQLESWQRGESMVIVRNPAYHGHSTGNLERVELSLRTDKMVSGQAAGLDTYDGGQLDVLRLQPPTDIDGARRDHPGEYVSGPLLVTYFLVMDLARAPFDDPRVRRAFVIATDRETLAGVTMRGLHSPATGGFVPPGMPGHSQGIALPYDPEPARQLLAEAGFPGGRRFPRVEALILPGRLFVAQWLQAHWRENLGVDISWQVVMEWEEYMERMLNEPPHLYWVGWEAEYPDPDYFLGMGIQFHSTWRNRAYEGLIEETRRMTDQEERMSLYRQADRILVDEAPILPLTYERYHWLVKPWVRSFPLSPSKAWFWKDVIIDPH
jgi:ABC-type oligopeptide transport system substrate-binding subunit/tetratricopeptide (TPR) repeat protein